MTAPPSPPRLPAVPTDDVLQKAMEQEERFIVARRTGLAPEDRSDATPHPLRTGLALSGGGIRSATFSLGILQALSRAGLLPLIDYLSTVSGGSYIGSFFGALYVPPADRSHDPVLNAEAESIADFAKRPLQSARGRMAVANVREFGRYLTPGGASDTMYGIALVARNWFSLQVVLGIVPLFLFLTVRLLDAALTSHLPDPTTLHWPTSWASIAALTVTDARPVSTGLAMVAMGGVLLCASTAIAYWLSRRESVPENPIKRLATNAPFMVALGLSIAMIGVVIAQLVGVMPGARTGSACRPTAVFQRCGPDVPVALLVTAFILACAVTFYIWALVTERRVQRALHDNVQVNPADEEENVRSRLTRRLATTMLLTIVVGAAVLVDYLGGRLTGATAHVGANIDVVVEQWNQGRSYGGLKLAWRFFWPFLAIALPALLTVWAHGALRRGSGAGWLTRPGGQAALGLSILFFWMVIWAAIARGFDDLPLVVAWIATGVWIGIISLCYGFLNQSSLVSLYASRLKRAYVGASNPSVIDRGYDIGRDGDTIDMIKYYGQPDDGTLAQQRPVHLINLTIAQTQPEGASHVVAYDRKGKPMHVGPHGLLYQSGGVGRSARKAFTEGEQLTLSTWTAISGAAASTAIGSMTSLGLSILALMANVRLGYWWKSTTASWYSLNSLRDTVLGYLLAEMRSSFSTDDDLQRWYLSDGGHFENTGAYALIQRRLDFIVVCDNGADPDYQLDDVVRLIDRARSDLNAEISFLDTEELDTHFAGDATMRACFGSYAELASPPPRTEAERKGKAMPYAALARITYDIDDRQLDRPATATATGPAQGLLMLIKPRLNFAEPPELLAYQRRAAGAQFPQQTTLDQFFDEDQWEAYRRFGEVVGERLFPDGAAWSPAGVLRGSRPLTPPAPPESAATGASAGGTDG